MTVENGNRLLDDSAAPLDEKEQAAVIGGASLREQPANIPRINPPFAQPKGPVDPNPPDPPPDFGGLVKTTSPYLP